MMAAAEIKEAEAVAGEIAQPEGSFDWRAWYLAKRDGFTAAARSWRQIAHTAQLDGDMEVVRLAHGTAQTNERWARDAAAKAEGFNAK